VVITNYRTDRFDAPLKVAILVGLPVLFGIWLGLSIAGSFLVGVGYGFFTPWVSAFEAFRQENESNKFLHCIVVNFWALCLFFFFLVLSFLSNLAPTVGFWFLLLL
jgi:hypothetical protein